MIWMRVACVIGLAVAPASADQQIIAPFPINSGGGLAMLEDSVVAAQAGGAPPPVTDQPGTMPPPIVDAD